jgi:hypothetical protein
MMLRWISTAAVAALAACAVPHLGTRPSDTGHPEADARFATAYERWNQEKQIYSGFDVKMFFGVTDESMEFRQARVERLGLLRASTQIEIDQQLAKEKADHEKYQDFTIGVHANERQFDDFDRKDAIWRTALVTPKGEELPINWDRFGRPDLNVRALYPYLGDFWILYHVRFNRVVPADTPVTLRLASSVGRVDFDFPAE